MYLDYFLVKVLKANQENTVKMIIPSKIRRAWNLKPGEKLLIKFDGKRMIITPMREGVS